MSKESLKGKAIVISGVFEKYSRKELKDIISKGGGKASSSISKNTSFILAGDKMGPSKKEKAIERYLICQIVDTTFVISLLHNTETQEQQQKRTISTKSKQENIIKGNKKTKGKIKKRKEKIKNKK